MTKLAVGLLLGLMPLVSLSDVSGQLGTVVSLSLVVSPLTIREGDTRNVTIWGDFGTTPISAFQVYLDFDPSIVEILSGSVTLGSVFPDSEWVVLQNSVDNSSGKVNFAGGKGLSAGSTDITGLVDLGSFQFTVLRTPISTAITFDNVPPRQTKAVSGIDPVGLSLSGAFLTSPPNLTLDELERRILDLEGRVASLESVPTPTPIPTLSPTPTPTPTVWWIEDGLPVDANAVGIWDWISSSPLPFSGSLAHKSSLSPGIHQHYFTSASQTLSVGVGESLVIHIFLDPDNPPREVMLQWYDGSWEHRAYWGANLIPWGGNNSTGRRFMGPLPSVGQWVKLEISASAVALEGRTISGMAFSLYDGSATWDAVGKE